MSQKGNKQKKRAMISFGIVAQNRKAQFNYTIHETIEAGLVLLGAEVKSLRLGHATITESFACEREGDLWLVNSYIPEYQGGVFSRFETRAPRKLLLHRKQLRKYIGLIAKQGVTLVPLDIHFNDRGFAKVTLGLGVGKKSVDKRHAIAERDWQRDKARLMRNKNIVL